MEYRNLVFVYRTDVSPVSLLSEFAREVLFDDAYQCSLCHLTYRGLVKKSEWKRFIDGLPITSTFRLRSAFLRKHPEHAGRVFPTVFIEDADGALHEFLDAQELRACTTLEELIAAIEQKLDDLLTPRRGSS